MVDFRRYSLIRSKRDYQWPKYLKQSTIKRHEWLSKIWIELYRIHQDDEFLRKLSTDEMMKTNWFEKYGIKEPNFD